MSELYKSKNIRLSNGAQMVVVLTVLGIVSGALLAGIYKYAQPKIEAHRKQRKQEAIYRVLGKVENIETIKYKNREIYQGLNGEGKVVGYAFEAKGGGYQGEIILMLGLSPDLNTITGIEVVENVETPGLGGKIEGDGFKGQFKDLNVLKVSKVKAITGATISSRSVIRIVKKGIAEAKEIIKENER